MKKSFLFILLIAAATVIIPTGCKKEPKPDTEKPSVEVWSPTENAVFNSGSKLGYSIRFRDNNQLYSFKIDITALSPTGTSWVNHYTEMIDGTEHEAADSILIPASVDPGYYNFSVTCNDTSYNEKNVVFTIKIN